MMVTVETVGAGYAVNMGKIVLATYRNMPSAASARDHANDNWGECPCALCKRVYEVLCVKVENWSKR